MIPRAALEQLLHYLRTFPVVALLGPRQVGKTTLAFELRKHFERSTLYLDMERPADRAKLDEPDLYLRKHTQTLVIIDEVQRRAGLFEILRGLVDERRRAGDRAGHYLVLGSASRDLLQQSSETLAGRIAYLELEPLSMAELWLCDPTYDEEQRWLRGGFPDSLLAPDDAASRAWRENFIATYLERDIPQLGPRLPAELLRRFWSMLVHSQGAQLNASRLAAGLGVTGKTVRHYLDVLTDLYMVRQLQAWSGNSGKRLVKAPKVYVRDSGLSHTLANVPDMESLLGHPLCGPSWEGFVVEAILASCPESWRASYYRTSAQAEIDLVLERPNAPPAVIEIKRSATPKPSKGFHLAAGDIGATEKFVVGSISERYGVGRDVYAMPLRELLIWCNNSGSGTND